jgi:hypothetical protein
MTQKKYLIHCLIPLFILVCNSFVYSQGNVVTGTVNMSREVPFQVPR